VTDIATIATLQDLVPWALKFDSLQVKAVSVSYSHQLPKCSYYRRHLKYYLRAMVDDAGDSADKF